jgi:hypothetical protein
MRAFLIALLALVSFCTSSGKAHTIMERVGRDELKLMPDDDPHMSAAMRKARATLPEFLSKLRSPHRSMRHMSWGFRAEMHRIEAPLLVITARRSRERPE